MMLQNHHEVILPTVLKFPFLVSFRSSSLLKPSKDIYLAKANITMDIDKEAILQTRKYIE